MSLEKSIMTQMTLNDLITLKEDRSLNSLNVSMHQDTSSAIHSHTQFMDKYEKSTREKGFCFGTKSRRNIQEFWEKHQTRQKNPGPGSYNVTRKTSLKGNCQEDKSISFGTMIQRFDNKYKTRIPGPGSYFHDESLFNRKIRRKKQSFPREQNYQSTHNEVPGPGFYGVPKEFYKCQIEEKRQKIRFKLAEVRSKRKQISKLIQNKRDSSRAPRNTYLIYKHQKKNRQSCVSLTKKKSPCTRIFKTEVQRLQRCTLREKTENYLPGLQLKSKFDLKSQPVHECNISNNFIDKKDSLFQSYIPKHEINDPGNYQIQKEISTFKKKSSFFMSSSKRKVF